MRDMEDSQNFISGKYDSLSTHTETNTNSIATLTSELKTLKTTNTKLKEDNALFRDDIIDLKCRSMSSMRTREQRICKQCNLNVIENEQHFLFDCPKYITCITALHNRLQEANLDDMQHIE